MTKHKKLVDKIKAAKTVDFGDIDLLLTQLGFKCRNNGTSHYTYTKAPHVIVIVKHGQQVKRVYLENVRDLLERLGL
jgi:hypothetical protein